MMMNRSVALALGVEVLGADGLPIGAVKGLAPGALLIDRPWRRDLYVPYAAIRALRCGRVVLPVPAAQVGRMGWPHPPLLPL